MYRYRCVCAYTRTQAAAATLVKSAVALVGLGMGITVILSYQELRATDGVIGAAMWALSTVFFVWVCSPLLAGYAGELAAAARGVSGVGSRKKKKTARRLSGAQQRQVWLVVIHS